MVNIDLSCTLKSKCNETLSKTTAYPNDIHSWDLVNFLRRKWGDFRLSFCPKPCGIAQKVKPSARSLNAQLPPDQA